MINKAKAMEFTGERFVPEEHGNIELEHLHRYLIACELVSGKDVLDIASGEGYGSAMLAEKANSVIGVDISEDAVNHSRSRYTSDNLEYRVGSCADIPLPDSSIDLIVSFETIEHHDRHEEMMQEFKRVLRPAGVLLISSPDKYNYSIEPGFTNQYHVKELYRHELKDLLGGYFSRAQYFGQRIVYGSGLFSEALTTPIREFWKEGETVRQTSGMAKPIYWVALASDAELPELPASVYEVSVDESEAVAVREGQIANLNQSVAGLNQTVGDLNQTVADLNQTLADLNQTAAERDGQIANLKLELDKFSSEIQKAKAPLRLSKQIIYGILHPFLSYRLIQDIWTIKDSNLFDSGYYLSTYRDVGLCGIDPIRHYCEMGWKEKRNPSPLFNTNDYLVANPEVAEAGANPLVHHILQSTQVIDHSRKPATLSRLVRHLMKWLVHFFEPKKRLSLISSVVLALLVLPVTFFHYDGWRGWLQALGTGKFFFWDVLHHPDKSRERLAEMPLPIRILVSATLSAALRIVHNGGVLPSLYSMFRILIGQGPDGVVARLTERVPSYTISKHPPPDSSRILVMDYRIPMAEVSAGERATAGILRDLCAFGYDVVFLPHDMLPSAENEERLREFGVTVITNVQGYHSAIQYLSQHGHTFAAFYLIRIDVVETVLDTIRQVAPQSRVIFHAPDVYFLRESREAELKADPNLGKMAETTKARELAVMRKVDHTVIVSPAELPVLRQYLADAPISVFPVLYAPVVDEPAPFDTRKGIFFLGGFEHTPNVDAVLWFVGEIWPQILEQLPEAVFHIVGSKAPQEVLALGSKPGVVVDGFVQDLDPLLSSMRLGVAPLRFGAGIKGKVAMTMGAGIPCVCTSIATEGMGVENDLHAIVADDPGEFAQAVTQIYADRSRWERLSVNGRNLVRRRFGNEANRSSLLSVLNAAESLPLELFIKYCKAATPRPITCPAEGDAVDVSIIVPVYNQWDYTRACLNSILETTPAEDVRYEIILADDGSTDETITAAQYYPGLRVVKTPQNVGFLRNCNNAANYARGKHILLLNNDTVVLPGWLSALHQLIEKDESAAIVGSKLLYPDGTIQEAGAVLWNDGTATNIGRYQFGKSVPRNNPDFAYIREVDYVSGSCILIRKSFWDTVGGFDEGYENAYCEDSDLAFMARAKGMRILYQPKSEVIHFEHKSYAGERSEHKSSSGERRYLLPVQEKNIQRLRDKWRNEFANAHLSPGTSEHLGIANAERSASPETIARRRQGKLNVLFYSPFPSHPSSHGNQSTIQQFGRLFQSMGHKVHFALLKSHMYSDDDEKNMRACWDTLDILPNSLPLGANGEAIPFDGWYEEGLGERIRGLCAQYEIDVVFCSYVFQSKLLEFVPSYMLKVIDTHDKMGNRYEMLRANGQPLEFFSCTPEEEGAYLRRADVVVARREEEARYFDSVTGRASAIVIPHVEDSHFIENKFTQLNHVGIVASANRINLAIVKECLEAIDHRLNGGACPFIVHIAGQVKDMVGGLPRSEAAIFAKPWVKLHGFVPDIAGFYADMDVVISPVTMGTGINVKTVQAMAYGMPLLTTAWGAKGIETGDPIHSHADLNGIVDSLLSMKNRPEELERLAEVSRTRYASFYEESLASTRRLFEHPKLMAQSKVWQKRDGFAPPSTPC